ncbi:hypothetical protein GCM10022250_43290 [Flavobacterium chungbukense]|uniref:Transposase n=1 Tax=Flavobacterium chungbukense TaxID=877464 RepID=A0ABP7YUI2_9FLAO
MLKCKNESCFLGFLMYLLVNYVNKCLPFGVLNNLKKIYEENITFEFMVYIISSCNWIFVLAE